MDFIPKYTDRFEELSKSLIVFSEKHGLHLSKYYHDAPMWSFAFEHPNNGPAKIDLSIDEERQIRLQSVWWFDSYREFTRYLKWGEKIEITDKTMLIQTMENELKNVLDWKLGTWTTIANEYEEIWGSYSKQEFESMSPKLPKIKR